MNRRKMLVGALVVFVQISAIGSQAISASNDPTQAPKRLLVIQPTHWDEVELAELVKSGQFEIVYEGTTTTQAIHSGVRSLINPVEWARWMANKLKGQRIDGVLGMDDHPAALLASLLSKAMGLRGTPPQSLVMMGNKFKSRQVQKQFVPEAVPDFQLVDPANFNPSAPPLPYPFFLKPVRGAASFNARMIRNAQQFTEAMKPNLIQGILGRIYNRHFNYVSRRVDPEAVHSRMYIAEQPLKGVQVTVDGFVQGRKSHTLGVVDSVMFPETNSFESFQYPSHLPLKVQQRMVAIANKLVEGSGLDNTAFNIEMFYDRESDQIHIIEINPRMSMQFSDLHEKVDGIGLYRIQADLATGEIPGVQSAVGQHKVSASFVVRKFKGDKVHFPEPEVLAEVQKRYPDARIYLFPQTFMEKIDNMLFQDPESELIAYINIGGEDRQTLRRDYEEILRQLDLRVESSKKTVGSKSVCRDLFI